MVDKDEVQCPCCKLMYPASSPRVFSPRTVPLDHRLGVCWDCTNHQGDSETVMVARGKHHGRMLRREYERARELLDAARQDVVEMERELAMRPVRTVVRVENLDQIIVDVAKQERDEAYHRRDVAMGALSDVRLLHHQRPNNRSLCECGKQYEKCAVAQIADRWEGVLIWEQSQAGRAFRGDRHYLDHDHPALRDKGWFVHVYGRE